MKKLTALLLAIFAVICIFSSCAGQKAESSRDRTESSRPGGTQEISVSAKRKMIFISMTTMTMRKAKVTRM